MSGPIPGYPVPALDASRNEVRADPDEENPHELVLDASEVSAGLPPLPHADADADDEDQDRD